MAKKNKDQHKGEGEFLFGKKNYLIMIVGAAVILIGFALMMGGGSDDPNIFNEGVHYIDPAVVYKGGTQTADWWEDATRFTVYKKHKTPYIVNPPVQLKVK